MRAKFLGLVILFGLGALAWGQSPTANNTSACSANGNPSYCNAASGNWNTTPGNTGAQTQLVDPQPTHVSEVTVQTLGYAGATTRYIAAYQPWFCNSSTPCNSHINIGYNENNASTIAGQVTKMIARGLNSLSVDWYGTQPSQSFNLATTTAIKTYLSANNPTALDGTPFTMHIMVDKGALLTDCPPTPSDATACLIASLNSLLDYVRDNYAEPGGTIPTWYETWTGSPLVEYFISKELWPGSNWTTIYNTVHAHVATYAHPFVIVDEFGDFTEAGTDGQYAWVRAVPYNISDQICWQQPGGCGAPYKYYDDFYVQALKTSNAGKLAIGAVIKGFDDANASWGSNRVIAQQCGQLPGLSAARPSLVNCTSGCVASHFSATTQLPYLMVETWNDWEEGTESESGVNNCYTIHASIAGSVVSWGLTASDATYATTNTVAYYNIFYDNGGTLTPVATNLPGPSSSISGLIPAGTWNVYVQMVGTAEIISQMSNAVSYTSVGPAVQFYVAPASLGGNDSNPGTSAALPFLTIVKARNSVSTRINGDCTSIPSSPIVWIRAGVYYHGTQPSSLAFSGGTSAFPSTPGTNDNGCSGKPTIYQNYPGEQPVLSGGLRVTSWAPTGYTCGALCTQYKVAYTGPLFENLWYIPAAFAPGVGNNVPRRRFRPRVGATAVNPMSGYSFACTTGTCSGSGAVVAPSDACSLSTNGCSGGTNSGCTVNGGNCWDRIRVPSTVALANWANLTATGTPTCDVEFIYWEVWTQPIMRICAVDLVNHLLIFSGPFNTTASNYGPQDGHRFIIENEKDSGTNAITLPSQWFLDRTVSPPQLYYNAAVGENPNSDTVEIPVQQFVAEMFNLQYVIFRGLTFREGNYTVPTQGYLSTQSEPSLPADVSAQNITNVNFEFDTFENTTGDGLEIIQCRNASFDPAWCYLGTYLTGASSSNFYVQHSNFLDNAGGGLQIGNKSSATIDTDTTVAYKWDGSDNLIDGIGRRFSSSFGFSVGGANTGNIQNNEIHDTYHAGIAVCVPPCTWGASSSHGVFGVNSFFNLLYNITQGVVSDIGALYYATGYGIGQASGATGTSNRIWNNVIHDVNDPNALPQHEPGPFGGNGIYIDNLTASIDAEYNAIWRVSSNCLNLSKGIPLSATGIGSTGPNILLNNICAYARLAMINTGAPTEWATLSDFSPTNCPAANARLHFKAKNNVFYFDRTDTSPGGFFVQKGCADSCGNTYQNTQLWTANEYWRTDGLFNSYAKAFHVAHVTANPIGPNAPSCGVNTTDWDYATPANWQCASGCSFTDSTGAASVPVVIPHEDAGGSFNADPGFTSPGYPNNDYTLTCPLAIAGFNCTQTNLTLAHAGRITHKTFNPVIPQTYPTAEFDASHTNNGQF